MAKEKRIALVTGANKGLGFEVCRQLAKNGHSVILTSRDPVRGKAAVAKLQAEDVRVTHRPLDVTDEASIKAAFDFVEREHGRLDVLVNNAGIMIDPTGNEPGTPIYEAKVETIRESLETNTFGAFRLCQRFVPLMLRNGYGRVVNVSSGMGQLSEMNGGYPGYRLSKTALNAVTRIFHDEVTDTNVLINSVCPGWVRTDMGGSRAELSIEEGADTIVWLATLPDGGPSGGFFRQRKPISW